MRDKSQCRICGGALHEFVDFGRQPMANAYLEPSRFATEFFYRLAVGMCDSCTMVQLIDEVPNERMFHKDYPYSSSGSTVMRAHFESLAHRFVERELQGPGKFIVEIGSNDGIMLNVIAKNGLRHLGVEPCDNLAKVAAANGVRVLNRYFDESSAAEIVAAHGRADVIFAANTVSHISRIDSVLRGVDRLLSDSGVFVFEDPYFLDIVDGTSFDQIYDEHIYFFTARSVAAMAARHGFELVDTEHLPVHGGEVRYTLARPGARTPARAIGEMLERERGRHLTETATLEAFAASVARCREELVALLRDLRGRGKRIVGYGATAKSATMMNYCGIGPDLVSYVCDNTPAKQGLYTPGTHVPIRPPEAFREGGADYALLLAWNHADEIMKKEAEFREAGGRWILYVPQARVV
ncbi:methyltransferase domain-containing protein [Actinomadura luteofluorescens]|uniref:methyltransferase domain-containing protein n=1 Tax=Actinomadura luteofluorescens TaxID=46163 RepID=UPI00348C1342